MDRKTRLKQSGLSCTRWRYSILKILKDSHLPLTSKDIYKMLPNPKPNLATVYRNLNRLVEKNLVRCVTLGERARYYELIQPDSHKHRIICKTCGQIEAFEPVGCDLKSFEKLIREKFNFKVEEHSLEFFGTCPRCQSLYQQN